jgi:hypothetical protein
MRFSVLTGAGFIAATCASCTTPATPPDPTKLVAVADVLNSVFCGLGLFVQQSKDLAKKQGSADYPLYAKLTLGLKVINSTSIGINAGDYSSGGGDGGGSGRGGASSGGGRGGGSGSGGGSRGGGSVARTSVIGGATPAVLPSFGLSNSSGWTVDTLTELNFQLNKVNSQVCASANVATHNGDESAPDFGLSQWLAHTLVVYAAANGAIGGYQDYDSVFNYDATFAVDTKAGGRLGYQLAIIPLSANADTSQNNVQQLKLVISNKPISGGGGGNAGGGGGPRTREFSPAPYLNQRGGEAVPLSEVKPVPYF